MPQQVIDLLDAKCASLKVSRSERVRQLVERDILTDAKPRPNRLSRRLRRLRRCVTCSAFVRNGYTCKTCRITLVDSVSLGGRTVALPYLPRPGLQARPDVRDPAWAHAEAIVLDAYAPVVAIVYEAVSGEDSYEMTDLDDIADLLAMAASFSN